VAGHSWSLWSARGRSGANGLEDGGLLIDGRAYGLCPGFANPAELELADIGTGLALPAPAVTVVHGVSFFIGTVPKSACDYPSLELNAAAREGSSQHNLGFGSCVAGQLVNITSSMGEWSVSR
jgi:hypothetical protein